MNSNAKKWVTALRSGKYKQGQSYLRTGNRFCCLGVACDLFGKDKNIEWDEEIFLTAYDVLPYVVMEWLGLNKESGSYNSGSLVSLNDDQERTFKQIADIIESEPEGLFVKETGVK